MTSSVRPSWELRCAVVALMAVLVSCCLLPVASAGAVERARSRCERPAAPGTTTEHLTVDGVDREYRLSIPASYDGSTRVPLVFNFHGLGSNMDEQEFYSGLEGAGRARGYVVVTPQGRGGLISHWSVPPLGDTKVDVDFAKAMLDAIERSLCIDSKRVYSTGMSNGAMFATLLACRLPGRLAAIAPVAGVNVTRVCPRTTPRVSVLAFHGTADPVVPYDGGPILGGTLPILGDIEARPVGDAVASWAAFNGCASEQQQTAVAVDVERVSYPRCARRHDVELVRVEGGGHTWPGGIDLDRLGATTASINATTAMLDFFDAHPRAR
jgi:polyhydroxybutyrate depolymerase